MTNHKRVEHETRMAKFERSGQMPDNTGFKERRYTPIISSFLLTWGYLLNPVIWLYSIRNSISKWSIEDHDERS